MQVSDVNDDYDQPDPRLPATPGATPAAPGDASHRVRPAQIPPGDPGVDEYDTVHADWYAPEDESRVRTLLFKYLPILFLVSFALWPAWWKSEFLWRDDVHVTANKPLASPQGLWVIWKSPTVTPDWAPLSYSMLWPQHYLWSTKQPMGYHLISLFLHSFNAIMVWMLLRRLDVPGAFAAAVVFAIHPLQVEAAGWIARQPMMWGAFWGLLYMLLYLRYGDADSTVVDPSKIFRFPEAPWLLYALAILTYGLALLSYPILVSTLPLVMLLLVWWKKDDFAAADVYRLAPFFVMSAAMLALNRYAENQRPGPDGGLSGLEMVLVPAGAVWFYIGKLLLPIKLMAVYPKWDISQGVVLQWLGLVSLVVLPVALWIKRREIGKTPFVAMAAYLLLLLPMVTSINRVEMQWAYVADRFHYLATAAAAAVLFGLIAAAVARLPRQRQIVGPVGVTVFAVVLSVVVFNGHAESFHTQQAQWQNTIEHDPDNLAARIRLGKVYQDQYEAQDDKQDKSQLDKAMREYERVDRLTGGRNLDAKIALGEIAETNDMQLAIDHYQAALLLAPDRPEPYRHLGPALLRAGKLDDAMKIYQDGLQRFPKDAQLHRLYGVSLAMLGQKDPALLDQAIEELKRSIELDPNDEKPRIDLANLYFHKKMGKEASEQWMAAVNINPRNFKLWMMGGMMLYRDNRFDDAYRFFRTASRIEPKDPQPYNNVGVVLTSLAVKNWRLGQQELANNRSKEAIGYFERALQLKPDFESAKRSLEQAKRFREQILKGPPPRLPTTQATQPAMAEPLIEK